MGFALCGQKEFYWAIGRKKSFVLCLGNCTFMSAQRKALFVSSKTLNMLYDRRNKLVIIGNGFDLAHNLKTSYQDYMVDLINLELKNYYNRNYHNLQIMKHENVNSPLVNNVNSLDKFIEGKRTNNIRFNFKSSHIEELIMNYKRRWVDVEYFYFSKLLFYYRHLEKIGVDYNEKVYKQLKQFNEDFELIKNTLVSYLNRIDYSAIETNPTIQSHFDQIIAPVKNNGVYIVNFNYTSTVKKYLPEGFKFVNNIHGSLADESNKIIFGYGDESDEFYSKIERLNSNDFIKHFKSFSYLASTNYTDLNLFLSQDAYDVHIIGHSCGISDRVLFKEILNRKECMGVKFYYHRLNSSKDDFYEKTLEISRHFNADKKHEMRLKISKLTSTPLC